MHSRILVGGGGGGVRLCFEQRHFFCILFYRTPEDLTFADALDAIALEFPEQFSLVYFVTRENKKEGIDEHNNVHHGVRIQKAHVHRSVELLGVQNMADIAVCVCGPPKFPEAMTELCRSIGLQAKQVYFEKWW